MNTSSNTKKEIIDRLIERYGEEFKSPLARDLNVNVSTVRRIFNQKHDLPMVYEMAIEGLLSRNTRV